MRRGVQVSFRETNPTRDTGTVQCVCGFGVVFFIKQQNPSKRSAYWDSIILLTFQCVPGNYRKKVGKKWVLKTAGVLKYVEDFGVLFFFKIQTRIFRDKQKIL